MRLKYPNINLIGSSDCMFDELFNSLRYSTHGEFKIISSTRRHEISSSHHFSYLSSESPDYLAMDADFTIGLFDKNFLFFPGRDINKVEPLNERDTTKLNKRICEFLCNMPNDLMVGRLILDFLINHEGKPTFLAAQSISKEIVTVFDSHSKISQCFRSNFNFEINTKNKVGRFEVHLSKTSNPKHHLILNNFGKHWVGYRAFGINIPLLILQNLLLRDFQTLKLLEDSDVVIDQNYINPPSYSIEFKKVYFDLDETLICKNKPIYSVLASFKWFLENNKKIYLITRHIGNISEALRLIGLDESLFAEVIYVKPDKLKSEFIKDASIFVDNEFPQRRDVRLNCKIPCLDLDQIDFLIEQRLR